MKYFKKTENELNNLTLNLTLAGIFIFLLSTILTAPMVSAAGPATIATCDGIKAAYPILGTQCKKSYAKINHAPQSENERRSTFKARKVVLEVFRKSLLCNGMNGANKVMQDRFIAGENGHLEALQNLNIAAYTKQDLKNISIKKQQCK